MIVSRPRSPYVPANGTENAHGSYQFAAFPTGVPAAKPGHPSETPLVGFELKPGFKFGRSANWESRFLDTAVASRGVNGRPAVKVPMPCRAQPFTTPPKTLDSNRNGRA